MDTSDFYGIAVLALDALDMSTPMGREEAINTHIRAGIALRDFIRAADEEREQNNSRAAYRSYIREGERK